MPRKPATSLSTRVLATADQAKANRKAIKQLTKPLLSVGRAANGRFDVGNPGNPDGNPYRERRALNSATIRELSKAFDRGGAVAINKVMRNNPAMFLKMLVLLVPRELEVQHSGGVKAMTDEQIEQGIELIKAMLAEREANMVDVTPDASPMLPQDGEQ